MCEPVFPRQSYHLDFPTEQVDTMLLVMDVGNTNIELGVYDKRHLKHHWRLHTNRNMTEDEYAVNIKNLFREVGVSASQIDGVAIASVVPPLKHVLEKMCHKHFDIRPLMIGPGVKTGLNIKYENPREVGADRIVNAVAAIQLYRTPTIIVDFGTATTFCLVDHKGDYLGGMIAPGIGVSIEALVNHAAQLTRIELVKPEHILGKSTVKAMQSGVFYGCVGQVDGIVSRLQHEVNGEAKVVATGGLAELIGSETEMIHTINPFLTLEGLYFVYKRNQ